MTTDEDTRTVRLFRYTAQGYLLKHHIVLGFNVTMTCTTYLPFDIFAQGTRTSGDGVLSQLRLDPFLKYVASQLFFHLRWDLIHRYQICGVSRQHWLLSAGASFHAQPRTLELVYQEHNSPYVISSMGYHAVVQLLLGEGGYPRCEQQQGNITFSSKRRARCGGAATELDLSYEQQYIAQGSDTRATSCELTARRKWNHGKQDHPQSDKTSCSSAADAR